MKKIISTVFFLFLLASYSYSQFKADTHYVKKPEPLITKYLFGVNFSEPEVYKTFQTGYDKDNTLNYFSTKVKYFDYVITTDGEYYEFICKLPNYEKYKNIVGGAEIYFGEEKQNLDELSELSIKDEQLYLGIMIEKGEDKIHRIYENVYFKTALIWDKDELKFLVHPIPS